MRVDKALNPYLLVDHQDSVIFIRGILEKKENKFVQIIYNGTKIKLIKDPIVNEAKKENQDTGHLETVKQFNRRDRHYLIIDGKYKSTKLNKKSIIKILGMQSELESFIIENKLEMKKAQDFEKLLDYYERELMEM